MNDKSQHFGGKAIYRPKGKAAEYAKYACNFYVGCSNQCEYCYLRKGVGKATLGGSTPTLKKCFKDEEHALEVFGKELKQNLPELQKHGLFFSFTTDPFLDLTVDLTLAAMQKCLDNGVNVKVLTKNTENPLFAFIGCPGLTTIGSVMQNYFSEHRNMIAIGFTLTGHDELERNASTNAERIEAMEKLHDAGFKTWASIEPVIEFSTSQQIIYDTASFCDLFKIGLLSGRKPNWRICDLITGEKYDQGVYVFVKEVLDSVHVANDPKIYFKDSLLKQASIEREDLPGSCVTRDYNIFNEEEL